MRIRKDRKGRPRAIGAVMEQGRRKEKWWPDATKESQREAAAWELDERKRISEAITIETGMGSGRPLVSAWVDDYLDDIGRQRYADKTVDEKRSAMIRLAAMGSIDETTPVEQIDKYLARSLFDSQVDAGRSGNAVLKDRKNLGAAWNWGRENVKAWPTGENPFLAVSADRYPSDPSPRYVPPEADFYRVVDYLDDWATYGGEPAALQDRAMFSVFWLTAARRGEVYRLKRSDLDLANGRIRLWTRKRKSRQLEPDWLPMAADLKTALVPWLRHRMSMGLRHDYMFAVMGENRYNGEPYRQRRWWMATVCDRAGVDPAFGIHAIRHFTASELARKGWPAKQIQQILRHQSLATTERYLHALGVSDLQGAVDDLKRPGVGAVVRLDERRAAKQ